MKITNLTLTMTIAALVALSGCSIEPQDGFDKQAVVSLYSEPTPHSAGSVHEREPELPTDSPGPMPLGSFLMVSDSLQPSDEELRTYLDEDIFVDDLRGAFVAGYLALHLAGTSFATSPEEVASTTALRALSLPECDWCAARIGFVHETAAANVRITGGEFHFGHEGFDGEFLDDGTVVGQIPVRALEYKAWLSDGSLDHVEPEFYATARIHLDFVDGRWQVKGVSFHR